MKTKKEILEKIKKIREQRDDFNYVKSKPYYDICSGEIRTLHWVLGYKIGEWYWCTGCQFQHKNLKCPKCGNEIKVIPASK